MAKSYSYKKPLLKLLGLIVSIILLNALSNFPHIIEQYYSNGFYIYWSLCLRFIVGFIPFAMGDVIYVLVVAYILYAIFKSAKQIYHSTHKWIETLKQLLKGCICILAFYITFQLSWGLNYVRPAINQTLNIEANYYTIEDLQLLTELLSHKIALLDSNVVLNGRQNNHQTLTEIAIDDYKTFRKKYPQFNYSIKSVKPSLSSYTLSKFGVEGYFNPFTGEANINRMLPEFTLPFTYAHEIAHQIGIAKEDEANLLAYLSGIESHNTSTKYAAYFAGLTYILFELYKADSEEFSKAYDKTPKIFKTDLKIEQDFWRKHNSSLFGYMTSVLDAYLKFNKQESGIKSYREVVLWIYNIHKNELIHTNSE